MKLGNRQKVFIGLSGGVDSSVSAGLLKEAGFDVVGVFIKVWEPEGEKFKEVCTWRDDRRDAMRVASILGIPFITIDLGDAYKSKIIDYMIEEYKLGRTPNPDVMCNKEIKFGLFYDWASKNGADFIATGHYAQIENKNSEFKLKIGQDKNKDQSYFIWNIKTEQLPHILFPIGHLEKSEVRKLAEKFNLPTATKKDSQGLCFIGKLDVKDFLKDFIDIKPGKILNEQGKVIGNHDGVFFYTIGERHNFTIIDKNPDDKPYYIISKNLEENTLTVSQTRKKLNDLNSTIELIKSNWLNNEPIKEKKYTGRFRYRQELVDCVLEKKEDNWLIKIIGDSDSEIASGQSFVLYDKEICLGGGIIK